MSAAGPGPSSRALTSRCRAGQPQRRRRMAERLARRLVGAGPLVTVAAVPLRACADRADRRAGRPAGSRASHRGRRGRDRPAGTVARRTARRRGRPGGGVYGGEIAALRAAVAVKDRLRSRLAHPGAAPGPALARRQRPGEIATLATSGLDSLDAYYARYLPQVLLAVGRCRSR